MIPLNIRFAKDRDVGFIYNMICILENQKFELSKFTENYLKNIIDKDKYYLVAEYQNKIVGYISCHGQFLLHHNNYVFEIQELFVDEEFRNQKIASQLLEKLEDELSLHEYDSIEVTAKNHRQAAHEFYTLKGFTKTHFKFTKRNKK